ncbi:hypothetical protein JCM1841_003487 [Sporobolomyces salmonicolor]
MRPTAPSLLKLFALPLSRPRPSKPPLFLLHAHRPPPPSSSSSSSSSSTDAPQLPILKRVEQKAADMWAGLGKGKEGSWKKRSYDLGERLMDKIEYEEWALKAIDPAFAPKPWRRIPSSTPSKQGSSTSSDEPVNLIYPPSLLDEPALLDSLKKQLENREPHHRRAMWRCLLLSPLTWPFAIVPIVPNFPLFYVLWRAYSHWRAWKATQYLSSLLASPRSNLALLPSPKLDQIYASSPSSTADGLLLTNDKVPRLVKEFGLGEEERKELERAVAQSETRLRQARERLAKKQEAGEK